MSPIPFPNLTTRALVVSGLAMSVGLNLLVSILGVLQMLPISGQDPILALGVYIAICLGLCWVVLGLGKRRHLRLAYLLGPRPTWRQLQLSVALAVPLFVFSVGAFQLSYGLLAWVAPQFVETTLEQTLLLSPQQTDWPRLYQGLTVVAAVVVAPVAEELLFRGILLHRWSRKWGLGWGIGLTSLGFGLLHNNPVGLTLFGLVMALLYLHSRSLVLPMVAHGANNALVLAIDAATVAPSRLALDTLDPLAALQANWWLGGLCVALAGPWLGYVVGCWWPWAGHPLPYRANQMPRQRP